MDGLFGDGLVDVLCCGGDSLEEDLHWGPRLGAVVDLVEFEDGVTNGDVALFKIVEAILTAYKLLTRLPFWICIIGGLGTTVHILGVCFFLFSEE